MVVALTGKCQKISKDLSDHTYKSFRPYKLQSDFISQDGGVPMGDVGERPGVNKHWVSLRETHDITLVSFHKRNKLFHTHKKKKP